MTPEAAMQRMPQRRTICRICEMPFGGQGCRQVSTLLRFLETRPEI